MKTIKENNLEKVSEPEYGTILYRDRENPESFYLSVLCGGIGQYEKTLALTKAEYDELHLDDASYLRSFAYEIAKGKKGYEEVRIQPLDMGRLPAGSRATIKPQIKTEITYQMPPLVRIESLIVSSAFAFLFGALWLVIRGVEEGYTLPAFFGIFAVGFCVWVIDDIFSLLTDAATLKLSDSGLTIKGNLFSPFIDTVIPWVEIDSAPQIRSFFRIGRGPARKMLLIHLTDGSWKSISEVRINEDLYEVQVQILKFLDKYGKFDLARAIPVSTNPSSSKYSEYGGTLFPATVRDYAFRFEKHEPPIPSSRAIQMCFPKASQEEIKEAINAARSQ